MATIQEMDIHVIVDANGDYAVGVYEDAVPSGTTRTSAAAQRAGTLSSN